MRLLGKIVHAARVTSVVLTTHVATKMVVSEELKLIFWELIWEELKGL